MLPEEINRWLHKPQKADEKLTVFLKKAASFLKKTAGKK